MSKADYVVKTDTDFVGVMRHCANRKETWITEAFIRAYGELHHAGLAHSLEIYLNGSIVGGVYGVTLGSAFFAESMFHTVSNMSKVALFHLICHLREREFHMLECQFLTPHLASLGAIEISHATYLSRLNECIETSTRTF
jgi:leucyl/phenylalanyl-tRNA--protein transferase